jgi:DNA repair photolyase
MSKSLRIKVSGGDMYPGYGTISLVCGECEHQCPYCYVPDLKRIFPYVRIKYTGEYRLDQKSMGKRLVLDEDVNVVFVQSMGDMFAKKVPREMILEVLQYIRLQNLRVPILFQSKNPARFKEFQNYFPSGTILGTTIETDEYPTKDYCNAPSPRERMKAMRELYGLRKMVSIEPIMKMNIQTVIQWMRGLAQELEYVSVGADSGNNNLSELSNNRLNDFLWGLAQSPIHFEVRIKKNLQKRYELDPDLIRYLKL